MQNNQPNVVSNIPFHDFGGQGKIIHFAHANGYPPEGYQNFIDPFLEKHNVIASKWRPLWGDQSPKPIKSWNTFADDLIQFMDEQGLKNVIGMGHSMGGTISVIAALRRPDLFEKLILIDPVIFPKKLLFFTTLLPQSILKKIVPIAKKSSKRRDQWDSKNEVYQLWRKKRVFKKFSDDVLKTFVEHAIIPSANGKMTLAYSKEWETQVYITAPYIFSKMIKMKTPLTVIRGEFTDVLLPSFWKHWKQVQPDAELIDFKDAGHLIPMEYPNELANLILEKID